MIYRIIVLLGSFVTSISAIAGTMGQAPLTCHPENVKDSCTSNKWSIKGQALYLKSIYSANFAQGSAITGGLNNFSSNWGWGYRLQGNYLFNNSNDISIGWLSYTSKNTANALVGSYPLVTGPGGVPLILASSYTQQLANKLYQVNLDFGQKIDFSGHSTAHFSTGLQYSRLRVDHTNYFNIAPAILAATDGVNTNSSNDFNGVGPRVNIDYAYKIKPGLKLVANGAGSFLFGTSRYDFSTLYGNGAIVSSMYGSKRKVAPEFAAKLGLSYEHSLADGALKLEGGYETLQYWNAIQAVRTTTTGANLLNEASFSLYGPYFALKWTGNV